MTMRLLVSALFVSIVPVLSLQARLDYIDADGVTETGGTPDKARMLPRTKADGKLDASLLPPLGALASTPDPKRLYVSATVQPGGNGSPLAPFQTLQAALTAVAPGGAVIVAPGSYHADWAVRGSTSTTIVGCGPATVLTLTGLVTNSSDLTELRLVSSAVETLRLVNGRVKVRLMGTQVYQIEGSSSPLTVVRSDLGSKVGSLPSGAADTYSGHDTVPYAQAIGDRTTYMALDGSRPRVGSETVAFLSDVAAGTNGFSIALDALRAADEALSGRIIAVSNESVRLNAALATAVGSATNDLHREITSVSDWWGGQVSVLAGGIEGVRQTLTEYADYTTNQVDQLHTADTNIYVRCLAADAELSSELTSTFQGEISAVSASIPVIASQQAYAAISLKSNELVRAARQDVYTEYIRGLQLALSSLQTAVTELQHASYTNHQDILNTRTGVMSLHPDQPEPW